MFTTAAMLTLSLAKVMGVYMIFGGLSGFIARDRWSAVLEDCQRSAGLTYIGGVFVFVLGVAIVLAHNIWTDLLSGFISLFGWVAAIEGLVFIAFPGPLLRWSASMLRPFFITAFSVFTITLGVVLLVAGFTGTVSAP